jgi:nucleoside-diphosphate-sugar epimerase
VTDLARALVVVVENNNFSPGVYNAPTEVVSCRDLERWVKEINGNVKFAFNSKNVSNEARLIDFSLFEKKFGFHLKPIREYLLESAKSN